MEACSHYLFLAVHKTQYGPLKLFMDCSGLINARVQLEIIQLFPGFRSHNFPWIDLERAWLPVEAIEMHLARYANSIFSGGAPHILGFW